MSKPRSCFTTLRIGARCYALAIAAGTLAAGAAQAQSLLQLYDAAHVYDATYLAAKALADSAVHRAAQSDALRLPTATATAGTTVTDISSPSGAGLSSNNTQAAILGRQPLYNPGNTAIIEQANRSLQVAAADLEAAEQDLIVRVALAYFDVLAAQDALETTRASKKAFAEQLASAKRNFEVGTTTITDTREAQARFDLATAQEIASDNDLLTKRIALDQLVGKSGVKPIPLNRAMTLPPLNPGDAEAWVSEAWRAHPLIRKAQLAQEIAQLETSRARAGHAPIVDLVGSITETRATGTAVRASGSIEGTARNLSLGLQLNLPLFAGFSVQNRIKETLSLEEKARNDIDAAKRAVAQNTRQAFYTVLSGQAQVKALEAAESSSKLALESTQLGYRVGVRVNLDVLNAQTLLFATQRDLDKSRYDVLVNRLRLRQASGLLTPDDVKAADASLLNN